MLSAILLITEICCIKVAFQIWIDQNNFTLCYIYVESLSSRFLKPAANHHVSDVCSICEWGYVLILQLTVLLNCSLINCLLLPSSRSTA